MTIWPSHITEIGLDHADQPLLSMQHSSSRLGLITAMLFWMDFHCVQLNLHRWSRTLSSSGLQRAQKSPRPLFISLLHSLNPCLSGSCYSEQCLNVVFLVLLVLFLHLHDDSLALVLKSAKCKCNQCLIVHCKK